MAQETLEELDRKFHLHPFTNHSAMHQQGTHIIKSGQGCFVRDQQGRKLLDGLAGLWCVNVGYGRQEIIDAVHMQLSELAFYPSFFNSTTEPTIRLAAKIADLAPKRLKSVMFSNSGSEANETALKTLRAYYKIKGTPGKRKIISRSFSYHGVTIATTNLTGLSSCTEPFSPLDSGYIKVPAPYAYEADQEADPVSYGKWCISETEKIINQEGADNIAAFFAEPVQGAGGVIIPPAGYLKELRELCRKNNIMFIADEVITGFGRLGDWFASNLWELDPDIMTMAKGLSSGYLPLGATMISGEINQVLYDAGYWAHGFTYSGHPAACAAALASIDVIEKEDLINKVHNDIGPYFQSKLAQLKNYSAVGEARGVGLIGAIELLPEGGKKDLSPSLNLGIKLAELIRKEGVIVRGIRNLLAVSPALIISKSEIDLIFNAIETVLKAVDKG